MVADHVTETTGDAASAGFYTPTPRKVENEERVFTGKRLLDRADIPDGTRVLVTLLPDDRDSWMVANESSLLFPAHQPDCLLASRRVCTLRLEPRRSVCPYCSKEGHLHNPSETRHQDHVCESSTV